MTRRTALCLPLALLFLASVNPSMAQKTADEDSRVAVAAGAPLTVECRLRPEQRAEWRRDGQAPPPDMRAAPEAPAPAPDARLAARLRAPAARAHHAGLYTCSRERDHRVRVVVLPAQTAQPALPAAQPAGSAPAPVTAEPAAAASEAAPAAAAPAADGDVADVLYDVRGNISLLCRLPNENSLAYVWKKNGSDVEAVQDLKGRFVLERGGAEFHVRHSVENDFGNYSCALAGRGVEQRWAVRGRPYLKLPANSNVVEGQKLKLVCKVVGRPYPRVTWLYSNSSDEAAAFAAPADAALADSEQGVPDGALLLAAAARAHAGRYRCTARDAAAPAETVLRVKDMYAALWPFLGICAEVFVLCAIILVYEKRRTKPELDDSDTDNHDQKKS